VSQSAEFEVVDAYDACWRFRRADGYFWQWGVKAGTDDAEDHDMVEVWRSVPNGDGDIEPVRFFPHAATVGDCDPDFTIDRLALRVRPHPRWFDGEAVNLAAAAADAGEWLALIDHAHATGRWRFSTPYTAEKLAACREALKQHLGGR